VAGERSAELLAALEPAERIVLLPHANPDPDALASALALAALVRHALGRPSVIASSGLIGRSENRAMVRVLDIPLEPLERATADGWGNVVLLDTQPGRRNNALPPDVIPRAVIDHHPDWGSNAGVPFLDLRESYGATSTIVTEYLFEQHAPIDTRLATALFYGIASETRHFSRETTGPDLLASRELDAHVSRELLGAIESPALSRHYFRLVSSAVDQAVVAGDAVVAILDDVPYPDAVAEVADLLVRLDGAGWSVCLGRYGTDLYASVRANDVAARAGLMLAEVLPPGAAGGHGMTAGGRLPLGDPTRWQAEALRVAREILERIGRAGEPAEWLVPSGHEPSAAASTPAAELLARQRTGREESGS
jgi:nanoRNase/pAp phosphatase (c-di-AMP/oligoRNAs hydrolase)